MNEGKPQWTPGEWCYVPEQGGRVLVNDERATIVHEPPGSPHNEQCRADSILFAAAKDLYLHLERLLDEVGAPPHEPAFAALAKARGEGAPE